MTDDDFDDLHNGYQHDPDVQAAKQQLAEAIDNARQRAKDQTTAAARIEAERRAADPRYQRDFDRVECWPDCKPDNGYWGHTRNLGYCTQASRPKTPHLAAFVGLYAELDEEESKYCEEGMGAFKAADMALLWLAEHPETAAEIWPDLASTALDGDTPKEQA